MSETGAAPLHDWRLHVDQEKLAWLTFDRAGESANALGRRPLEELAQVVGDIEKGARTGAIKGVILMSGKERSFIVGADIREFEQLGSEAEVVEAIRPVLAMLDRIEALPVPVIAAVHGACVGGGLELILACHYRIATRDSSTKLGFPEVKLGIFPGFNGTVRAIHRAGPLAAMQHMLTGRLLSASAARGAGYVDELVAGPGELRWAARKAALRRRRAAAPARSKSLLRMWPARGYLAAKLRQETARKVNEAHYPAPFRLIDLFDRYGGDLAALKAQETRAFAPLMVSETARNLRRVFHLSELLKAQAPKGKLRKPLRVHVIGAGTMGADIAGWCAVSGLEVTVQDVNGEAIAKGIAAQGKLIGRKAKSKPLRDAAKARLIADPRGEGVARADVVIEAVVEKLDVKQKLLADVERRMKPDAVLASNTSSLRIEDIAAGLRDPGRLVGIHFFNPVAQMPLVEIVRGNDSRQEFVDQAAVFVTTIDKFPLVVRSVPGFLVNRVLAPYMMAAMKRVEEGADKELVDAAARHFGMPMGPIELADRVGLDVCAHVGEILGIAAGGESLAAMVKRGELGRKSGRGFYSWKDGKPVKREARYGSARLDVLGRELAEPLVLEARKALADGVVASAELVDAGLIFGTGFAPFRGGPLAYDAERKRLHDNAGGRQASAAE